jgi:hypothetical protein
VLAAIEGLAFGERRVVIALARAARPGIEHHAAADRGHGRLAPEDEPVARERDERDAPIAVARSACAREERVAVEHAHRRHDLRRAQQHAQRAPRPPGASGRSDTRASRIDVGWIVRAAYDDLASVEIVALYARAG